MAWRRLEFFTDLVLSVRPDCVACLEHMALMRDPCKHLGLFVKNEE